MASISFESRRLYEFGPFSIDTLNRRLMRGGTPVALPRKAVEALLILLERRGDVVEKQQLMSLLWPDTFVEEANLTQAIYTLRKVLGDEAIETIPRRGYRFAAAVECGGHAAAVKAPARPAHSTWIAAVAIVIVIAVIVWRLWPSAHRYRTIAVLPFHSLAANADASFGTGMADAVITRLGNVRRLTVRPTSAILRYAAKPVDPLAAGRALGVDAVVEGTVQRAGDRVRVRLQMISVASGAPFWGDTFDEKYGDLFALQDSISARVANALAVEITNEEKQRMQRHPTENTAAYEAFLQGRYLAAQFNRAGFEKGLAAFRRAAELDPDYGDAYAGIADCYLWLGTDYLPASVLSARAKEAALAALRRDPELAEAHAALAMIKWRFDFDWRGAEAEFRRAVDLDPGQATIHHKYGWLLSLLGRTAESKREMDIAHRLDPVSLAILCDVGLPLYAERNYAEAIRTGEKVIELNPRFSMAYYDLGLGHQAAGDVNGAIAAFQKAVPLDDDPDNVAMLARAYAVAGNRAEALRLLQQLGEIGKRRYVSPASIGLIHAALGETDEAFHWLDKAYDDRSWNLMLAKIDPRFDSLRSDPRFARLLARMGLG